MGIQEDIFGEFFKKLSEDDKFPNSIIEELKRLWENDEILSQDRIYEIIKNGCKDANKD